MLKNIVSAVCFIIFVIILSGKRLPKGSVFFIVAPLLVFFEILKPSVIWGLFSNSGLYLVILIGFYAHLMTISGFDLAIGEMFENCTRNVQGKHRETILFAIIFALCAVCSTVMANSSVSLAMVPAIYGISRKLRISRSKMVLFVIYATTLGGACTLIGTDTNIFANTALEEAKIPLFGMFDFAWVALPIAVVGGLYMILMNRWCTSYDDFDDEDAQPVSAERTSSELARMRRQRCWVGSAFMIFIAALILNSIVKINALNPYIVGFFTIGMLYVLRIFTWKEIIAGFNAERMFTVVGILAVIKMVTSSDIAVVLAGIFHNAIGDSQSLIYITTVLFFGTAIMTQFMNNMAAVGVMAPIGITLAKAIGADPRAIVMAIAIAAGTGYLTPFASGTNQRMVVFSKLEIQDFIKFGWPLVIITYVFCILILPRVFPFF